MTSVASKKLVKLAIAGITLVTASGIALTACDKDEGKKSSQSQPVPHSENQVPVDFKNTADEAQYKAKLSQMGTVLKSANGLELTTRRGMHAVSPSLFAMRKLLGKTTFKPLNAQFKHLLSSNPYGGPGPVETTESDDEANFSLLAPFQVGDDCSDLMVELSDDFRLASENLTVFVNQVAAVDWTSSPFLTKLEPNPAQEAFAYAVKMDHSNMNLTGAADETVNGEFSLNGRFSGGANEQQVSFVTGGALAVSVENTKVNGTAEFNAFSNLSQKTLDMAAGFALTATEEGQAITGGITTKTHLAGGDAPVFAVSVDGKANNGKENISGNLDVSLTRATAAAAVLNVSWTMNDGKEVKSNKQLVTMTIAKDEFVGETCKVSAVE